MNIDKIKKQLDDFQKSSTNNSKVLWKAPVGKSQIRLVEYKYNTDNPFVKLYFHFNIIKNKPILSPISYGEEDPIAEFAEKLRKTGSDDDKLLAKKLSPTLRVFAPIVVRGSENEGVKIWGFGKNVSSEIMSLIVDPDYGNIAHASKGRDLVVESVSPAEAGNSYGKTIIRPKPNATPLHSDPKVVEYLMENQPEIEKLHTRYTYDELKEILVNYLNPSDEKSQEKQSDKKEDPQKKNRNINTVLEDIDGKFDDMFGE